jgi:hypothetical protein
MPRPSIDQFWREQIRSVSANNSKLGPGPIQRELARIGESTGRSDWPSERTIGRELRRFRDASEAVRREYREFHWPATMERGDLPWQASAVGLELLRHLHATNATQEQQRYGRPLVSTVRWLWYVTMARPDLSLDVRLWCARELAFSATGIADCRLDVEAAMVGVERGETFFGEVVTSPFEGGIEVPRLEHEVLLGWKDHLLDDSGVPAGFMAEEERDWASEQTEREQSSGAPTDAGARPSRSKASGRTSSRKTAKKSPGS